MGNICIALSHRQRGLWLAGAVTALATWLALSCWRDASGAGEPHPLLREWRRTNKALERLAETYERDSARNHGDGW
jgi:hypothetical protein